MLGRSKESATTFNKLFISTGVDHDTLAFVASIAKAEPIELLNDLIRRNPYFDDSYLVTLEQFLFRTWAENDPEQALLHALKLDYSRCQSAMTQILSAALSSTSVEGFANIYAKCRHFGIIFQEAVARDFIRDSPADAAEKATKLPYGQFQTAILRSIGGLWAESDPDAVAEWANTLPPTAQKHVLKGMVEGWLRRGDVQAAAQYVSENFSGQLGQQLANQIVKEMAKTSPDTAIDWASTHFDGATKTNLIVATIGYAASENPTAALQIMETLPPGTLRFEATQTLANSWGQKDIASASAWLNTLEDSSSRNAALIGVASAWAKADPQGLAEYIALQNPNKLSSAAVSSAANDLVAYSEISFSDWINRLPQPYVSSATSATFGRLANRSLENALPLVLTLTGEEARLVAYQTISRTFLVQRGLDDTVSWINTLGTAAPEVVAYLRDIGDLTEFQAKTIFQRSGSSAKPAR